MPTSTFEGNSAQFEANQVLAGRVWDRLQHSSGELGNKGDAACHELRREFVALG